MLGFGFYSGTKDRVVLVIVLEFSFNRRKFSLSRLVRSFDRFLYVFLLLSGGDSGTSRYGTGRSKTGGRQQTRRSSLISSFSNGLFSGFNSGLSLVSCLLLSKLRLQLTLDSLTLSLNRVNVLDRSFLSLLLRGSLSSLSGCNRLSLDSGALQQEALTGGLAVRHTQVGCVNFQTVTQARVQGDRRTVPSRASLLRLGVQCRHGREPVNTGHHNAGFNLTTAVQQTVVHVLIYLAQFQAHGARTAGTHELRQAVESALLGESGQGRCALCGLVQDDGLGNQLCLVFAELLLSFLQLCSGLLSRLFTSGSLLLLRFLLVDGLCGQSDALRGALLSLLLSLFSLCGGGNSSGSSHGCSNSGKSRSYRGALDGLVVLRSGTFSRGVLNLGSRLFRSGFFRGAFLNSAFLNSGSVKDQLCGVLFFSVEVLSLECFRDGRFVLLLNGYSGEQLGLVRDRVFFLSKFRCQQFGCLNDSLNRLFLTSGNKLCSLFYACGKVNSLFGFEVFSSLSNRCGYFRHLSRFSGLCFLSSYLISRSFFSNNLIGGNLAEGLLFAIEGDAQASSVGGRQVVQTGVLCLRDGGAGAGCLHVFYGQGVLSISGSILRCRLRYRMSVLRLVVGGFYRCFDYLGLFATFCLNCSILSDLSGSIFGVLGTHSTQVLLKLGARILSGILRFLSLDRCALGFGLFVITQERGGSGLSGLSNRGGFFFNILDLSDLLGLNRLLRFLRESAKRRKQAAALLLLRLFLGQLISSGRFFNLLITVQEGTLEILNSAVLLALLFVVVLVACALRLHEAAQGVLPLLLLHNLFAQSCALGSVFACLFFLSLSSFGALFFARLFIQLLLADSKEAHWVSSSGVRRVMMRYLLHPPEGVWARGREHNANVLIILLILSRA